MARVGAWPTPSCTSTQSKQQGIEGNPTEFLLPPFTLPPIAPPKSLSPLAFWLPKGKSGELLMGRTCTFHNGSEMYEYRRAE